MKKFEYQALRNKLYDAARSLDFYKDEYPYPEFKQAYDKICNMLDIIDDLGIKLNYIHLD